jgi:hypothetical protein
MFSMKIVDTDAFMDMPQSTQLFYFHLSMRADDDGFVSNPKKVMRMVGSGDDDYKILIAKKFILPFESGVCVIKHWLVHNLVRSDRYTETQYIREKAMLVVDEKTNKYSLKSDEKINVIPDGNQMEPQVRLELGKDRIGKTTDDVEKEEILQPEKKKYEMADFSLAEYLLELIRANVPTFKQPDLEKWAEHVRLMRERDGRTFEQIKYLIKWCQGNSFWKANILSTSKLREKFDQLTAQVLRDRNGSRQATGKGVA